MDGRVCEGGVGVGVGVEGWVSAWEVDRDGFDVDLSCAMYDENAIMNFAAGFLI